VRGSGDYFGEFQVDGPVTCMLVVGNRASIKYPPGDPTDPAHRRRMAEFGSTSRTTASPPTECPSIASPDPTLNPAWNRIESGD
jgi:hypothetical protein